jgi:hypothetical protein
VVYFCAAGGRRALEPDRESRVTRLARFKSERLRSSQLFVAASQGRDLNPRTPDYKSGA